MNSIAIQQTLHGYRDGHRLLDGSLEFNEELSRLVLRMSDLSGSNIAPGFEDYLTGYPLSSIRFYALAKTWYAPEMPRPGCVWTHTLFIPMNDLGEVPDLNALTAIFRRPQGSTSIGGYSSAVQFQCGENANSLSGENLEAKMRDLLSAYYGQSENGILIGTSSSRAYENPIMRLWSQQWPQLRSIFTFCTGTLSARGFNGRPFEIQCSPSSLVREISAVTATKQSHELVHLTKFGQTASPWLSLATEDAMSGTGSQFRRLLWEFASAPERRIFEPLARLIQRLLEPSGVSLEDTIELVAENFPEPDSGVELKKEIFGHRQNGILHHFEEGDVLAALARTSKHSAFNPESLNLRRRASELCANDEQSARKAISQLFRSEINPLGQEIIAGMIEGVNPSIAQAITQEQPQFLPTLFRAKPELGVSPELWMAGEYRKRELLEGLIANKDLNGALIEKIVRALVQSGGESLIRRVLGAWGKPAVFGILDMMAAGKLEMTESTRGALTFHVKSVMEWLSANREFSLDVVVKVAHIVAPYLYEIRDFPADIWLNAFLALQNQGNQQERIYLSALLLGLGLQNAPPDGLSLVQLTFDRIHQIAWDDKISDDTWQILEPLVPQLFWLHNWDKCERLRRALVKAFVKFHWPAYKLSECVRNDFFLQKIVDSAKSVDGGRELIAQKT